MNRISRHKLQTSKAVVVAVKENLVAIETNDPMVKNEVAYIKLQDTKLKSEVLRIKDNRADLQVYENTQGVSVGDEVELTGKLLSATLGPGLLGSVFDGLQNPLHVMAEKHGFFLPRGQYISPLDEEKKWAFSPTVRVADLVSAGDVIGFVREGRFDHKIMVPFDQLGEAKVDWIQKGDITINTPVAGLIDEQNNTFELTMTQQWPIRKPLSELLLKQHRVERFYPDEPLITTIRLIDTLFPIALGGTACIPGPFGAGKTVLQSLIARYSDIDIVVIIACGERAGEVVETISEFPNMKDPHSNGSLMERTIIIANTSSMPVAARESSMYLGVTLAEYFRQMGLNVLVIADSTSRWAQAMRETSGRMEEIPGEEAFPAYLDSSIKNIYERAGVISTRDKQTGSLTMIGTVSPAGGNFEEPVTQATLNTVKTFLGLSSERAYRRYYPAIDPLLSWSRYHNQLRPWFDKHLGSRWIHQVEQMIGLLNKGEDIYQMMQVTGEEGISLEDYITWQKASLADLVYLQQDAFDEVDVSTTLERQQEAFELLNTLINTQFDFENKNIAREIFTKLINLFKNYNYSVKNTPDETRFVTSIKELLLQHSA